MLSVCIPTVGRVETLPTVLYSLLGQESLKEVLILDEADISICTNYVVSQVLDLLSLYGVDIRVIRNRRRAGIGAARVLLAEEAKCSRLVMVDDDVALGYGCLRILNYHLREGAAWVVPSCILVQAGIGMDGYIDRVVSVDDPEVAKWVAKYPWFAPYYRYDRAHVAELQCAGTQCIGIGRTAVLEVKEQLVKLGKLPREDTVLTSLTGPGIFDSGGLCYHFVHRSQLERSAWGDGMFYRLHEIAKDFPQEFSSMMGARRSEGEKE